MWNKMIAQILSSWEVNEWMTSFSYFVFELCIAVYSFRAGIPCCKLMIPYYFVDVFGILLIRILKFYVTHDSGIKMTCMFEIFVGWFIKLCSTIRETWAYLPGIWLMCCIKWKVKHVLNLSMHIDTSGAWNKCFSLEFFTGVCENIGFAYVSHS